MGKSTLLNQLFKTNFREMDALRGRSQTTKGIWMARCVGVEPTTIVMDLEGSYGRESGEDDTAFEKQSAFFALAVSDIVLINMWCHDIGCGQPANKPLLKTVFQPQDNNDVLPYWLSNSATLLLLLQCTLKVSGAASLTPQRRRTPSASLYRRVSQGLRASPQSGGLSLFSGRAVDGLDESVQVEAKYPALLFKQHLTAFLEKNCELKNEISSVLCLCIQAPRTSGALVKGRARANRVAKKALTAHWLSILKSLNTYLNTLRANYVFKHTFCFIDVQLFNSLLLRCECCSFSNGKYVKSGLLELEQWCSDASVEFAGSAWKELRHIKQVVEFLVVSNMRVMMTEDSSNGVSRPFLLDDDSSTLFSPDEISKSMAPIELADMDENLGFMFLWKRSD